MKRSEINSIIREALIFFREQAFFLPEFCNWSAEDWAQKGCEADEIRENKLGWDITDFGQGDFLKIGLLLITLRNGNPKQSYRYPKPYAEKIMVVRENQLTPMHFHWNKMEDIINRGGGNLIMKVYNSTQDEGLGLADVLVAIDGVNHKVPAGTELCLKLGQSVTLTPGLYHSFWAEAGYGPVLTGEVSMCNDDETDNRFLDSVGRFPKIEEDERPIRLLCGEYSRVMQ